MGINQEIFKKRFKELFFDQINRIEIDLDFNSNGNNYYRKYYYHNKFRCLGHYNQQSKTFWVSYYIISLKLRSEFTIKHNEANLLIKDILENHYKIVIRNLI